MIYMSISDERDIAEAVTQLIKMSIENHDNDLQEIANDHQERIEYLESLLKENNVEFN